LILLLRREKPDVVHNFTIKCVLYGSLACRFAGVRGNVNSVTGLGYVFTEGKGARRWLRDLLIIFYRFALRNSRVIFQNPDDYDIFLENRLVMPEKATLIPGSGVDTERFIKSPEPDGIPVVILPARLLWDKGVGEFVEAARLLRSKCIKARFALVGDIDLDNPTSVTIEQLRDWEKEGVIEWWGWKDSMEQVYAEAHIVCLPSYREGLPKTLVEAAACGRPIIAFDVPGCREIVRPDKNGLLVPVYDVPGLADAMEYLITNSDIRKSMGTAGREIVEDGFSAELIVSQTLGVYSSSASNMK
jgi:glycosyltransferase involved in cell wall biosynthesis